MKTMMDELGTAASAKKMVPIPEAGNHVLASPIQSKDIVTVEKETGLFLKQVMQLPLAKQ